MGSFSLPITLIFLACAILMALYFWVRQREEIEAESGLDAFRNPGSAAQDEQTTAVIVTSEHGQLLHVNPLLREWMAVNGSEPALEEIISNVQPADHFVGLLNAENQAAFQFGQRWVEATSHRVPSPQGQQMVVVMRELTAQSSNGAASAQSASHDMIDVSRTINVINEIGETVNASMGMETALQVLLEVVNKALPSDAGEVALWDDDRQYLRQRGWIGDTSYLLLVAERGGGYEPGDGVAGWMAETKQPFLLTGKQRIGTDLLIRESSYKCAIGVPLLLADQFVGTLIAHL